MCVACTRELWVTQGKHHNIDTIPYLNALTPSEPSPYHADDIYKGMLLLRTHLRPVPDSKTKLDEDLPYLG
jgi:hypothetical protein